MGAEVRYGYSGPVVVSAMAAVALRLLAAVRAAFQTGVFLAAGALRLAGERQDFAGLRSVRGDCDIAGPVIVAVISITFF